MTHLVSPPQLLQAWVDAVQTGSIENIVNQYAGDARLKGTVYDGYVQSLANAKAADKPAEYSITGYFEHFTQGKNAPFVEILSCQQQPEVNGGFSGYEGTYKFNWTDAAGDAAHTYANFEFSFNEAGKITKHHSSKWLEQDPVKAEAIIALQP